MNNQTTERIKESLVSSNPRGASGSDLLSVRGPNSKDESDLLSAVKTNDDSESMLSVRSPNSKDESDLLSALKIKDDSESLAEISFAGDDDENIKDPCAVCFTNRNFSKKATHFCNDCGLLGHFLCEQCLGFHKKFTNHKSVKSFAAAKYKRDTPSSKRNPKEKDTEELQNEIAKLKERIVIYRNELDPVKIRAELDLTDESMINVLREENLRLIAEVKSYQSKDSTWSTDHRKSELRDRKDKSELNDLRMDNDCLKNELIKLLMENDCLKYELNELREENEMLQTDLGQSTAQVTELKHEIKTLKEEHEKQLQKKE